MNPTQNDIATAQILADGIAEYCSHLVLLDGTEDADDLEHNALCFAQMKAGLAQLSKLIAWASAA